jgi:hypothetical protein
MVRGDAVVVISGKKGLLAAGDLLDPEAEVMRTDSSMVIMQRGCGHVDIVAVTPSAVKTDPGSWIAHQENPLFANIVSFGCGNRSGGTACEPIDVHSAVLRAVAHVVHPLRCGDPSPRGLECVESCPLHQLRNHSCNKRRCRHIPILMSRQSAVGRWCITGCVERDNLYFGIVVGWCRAGGGENEGRVVGRRRPRGEPEARV